MNWYKQGCRLVFVLLFSAICFWQLPVLAAGGASFSRTGEVHYVATEGGMFGILGDDGIKYQPTNLPRQFRKEGLPISFTAVLRDDLFTPIMWGTVVEVKAAHPLEPALSQGERTAIHVLLQRLDAFNRKDLAKLQQIDMESRFLSAAQFTDWIGGYSAFTLRYVDITTADSTTITGYCVYTRGLGDKIRLSDDADIAAIKFVLSRRNDGWKLTQSGSGSQLIEDLSREALAAKAKNKYGTDNLELLWQ